MSQLLQYWRPLAAAAVAIAAFNLGACTTSIPTGSSGGTATSSVQLPALSDAASYRDSVARTEAAIGDSAAVMAAMATECDSCATRLQQVQADAEIRLEKLGGQWEPWPDADAETQDSLPQPAPVGDAPLTPKDLVAYMLLSSTAQLQEITDTPELTAEEVEVTGAVLAGRILSAHSLAATYEVDIKTATANFPSAAMSPAALPFATMGDESSGTDSNDGDSPQSNAEGEERGELVVAAYRTYDCVAGSLPFTSLLNVSPELEASLFDSLTARLVQLDRMEETNRFEISRDARCVLETVVPQELFNSLIGADLQLLASGVPNLQNLAIQYLQTDLQSWRTLGLPTDPTPGLEWTVPDLPQSGD